MKTVMAVAVAVLCMTVAAYGQEKPRVYVTDSNSWAVSSGVGGGADGFGGASSGGARPQTAEIIKTFGQRCPQVVMNNRPNMSDYVVELDHEGGKGLLRHKDKIAVFVRTSGDSIYSKSTMSVGGSVEGACAAIMSHWQAHAKALEAASAPAPPMDGPAVSLAAFSISSNPAGADITIDGNYMGSTPSTIDLKRGEHQIVISRKGYQPWLRKLNVTGGKITINADLDAQSAGDSASTTTGASQ